MARNRRDKGEGHVSNKPRKDGRYRGYVTVGYKPNGKPNRVYCYGKTKAEVKQKLAKIKRQTEMYGSANATTPLSEYLERWLQVKRREAQAENSSRLPL